MTTIASHRRPWIVGTIGVALVGTIASVLLAPVAWAVVDAMLGLLGLFGQAPSDTTARTTRIFEPGPALRGVAVALGIATLAVLIAIPASGAVSRRRWLPALLVAPLLMPPYLAYSGWGILRDPTWWTGRLIVEAGTAGWAPKAIAFCGLALWAWPVAAMLVAASIRGRDRDIDDALALEPVGALARARVWVRTHRGALLGSWITIGAIMLGSVVPLHLSQFQTGAVRVWLLMDQTPVDQRWRVWAGSWLNLAAAVACATVLTGPLLRDRSESGTPCARGRRHADPLGLLWTVVALVVSVLVPMTMFGLTLGQFSAVQRFIERAGDAIGWTAGIAGAIGITAAVVAALTAWAAGMRSKFARAVVAWALRGAVLGALVPGVLVGEAWARVLGLAWLPRVPLVGGVLGDLRDQPLAIALAQATRLLFVPMLAGWWVARREPRDRREARALDRAEGVLGWWRAWGGRWWALYLAAGLATAALSVHEIEATVMVQPPGIDVLARLVLDDLHFERPDQRSAAGLILMGLALVPACVVAVVFWRLDRNAGDLT